MEYVYIHNSLKEIYFLTDSIAFLKRYIPDAKLRIIISGKVIYDGFLNSFRMDWKYRNCRVDHLEMDEEGMYDLFVYE